MSVAPKAGHQTPKQHAASVGNLIKARAAQRRSGALHHHTARQKAASRQNLVKARAAQKSRRDGKKYVSSKAAKAPLRDLELAALVPGDPGSSLHLLPVCAAVAVAESLYQQAGITATARQVWDLYQTGAATISETLEAVTEHGLAGRRLVRFEHADPGLFFPGLVYGVQLTAGYHAVLSGPAGMLSWGMVLPLRGTPEEAWIIEWEDADRGRSG